MNPLRILSLVLLFVLVPGALFAQETSPVDAPVGLPIPAPGSESTKSEFDQNFTSCFDYYRFGSTPIIISSELATAAQGVPVSFSGKITNENPYPLTDVAIYAKIFYRKDPSAKDSFGPELYDFFLVKDNITLKAGEEMSFVTEWTVPQDANLGEYQLATFVVDHDRFNLLGLIFSNDIIGSGVKFNVVGSEVGNTRFDIYKTTVGDQILHAAAFAPRVNIPEGGLPIVMHLTNTTPARAEGIVHWKLYSWDSLREENLIDSREQEVIVEAGQDLPLTYVTNYGDHAVYYLVAEFEPKTKTAARSIQAVRFLNPSVQIPRINFVGAATFPANKGDIAYACVHSTGTAKAEDARLEVVVRSNNFLDKLIGRGTLGKKTYEGSIPGMISALPVPMSRASDSFTVEAKLFQKDALIDEVSVSYSCSQSSEGCKPPFLLITIGVVVLVALAWYFLMRKRRPKLAMSMPPNPTP